MLSAFGVDIEFSPGKARLRGGQRLRATDIVVPADFSSAAFYLVAASIIPGSELRLKQVGLNPRRTGLLHALRLMGADITEENPAEQGGEPVADLVVRYAPLKGARIPEALVPDMIDEFPALFVAAAAAEGQTVVSGAAELRVKESDRLAAMATGLRALGMQVDETEDGATLHGGVRLGSGTIEATATTASPWRSPLPARSVTAKCASTISPTSPRPSRTSTAWPAAPDSTWPDRHCIRRVMPGGSQCPAGANLGWHAHISR